MFTCIVQIIDQSELIEPVQEGGFVWKYFDGLGMSNRERLIEIIGD